MLTLIITSVSNNNTQLVLLRIIITHSQATLMLYVGVPTVTICMLKTHVVSIDLIPAHANARYPCFTLNYGRYASKPNGGRILSRRGLETKPRTGKSFQNLIKST